MAKRIIEENVVVTTFDVDDATRKKSKKALKEHIRELERAYSNLSQSAQNSLSQIDRVMDQLSRDLSRLTYQNALLTHNTLFFINLRIWESLFIHFHYNCPRRTN